MDKLDVQPKRPASVTVAAVLTGLGALLFLAGGLTEEHPGRMILLVALGVGQGVLAWGLLTARNWARALVFVVIAINILLGVFNEGLAAALSGVAGFVLYAFLLGNSKAGAFFSEVATSVPAPTNIEASEK